MFGYTSGSSTYRFVNDYSNSSLFDYDAHNDNSHSELVYSFVTHAVGDKTQIDSASSYLYQQL
jgi:hypothetical protein